MQYGRVLSSLPGEGYFCSLGVLRGGDHGMICFRNASTAVSGSKARTPSTLLGVGS